MPEYKLYCNFGRLAFFARDDREAAQYATAYAARHGLRVSVLDMARERPSGRYVTTASPTWVADNVFHLILGAATPDVPAWVN